MTMEIVFWVILLPLAGMGIIAWMIRIPERGAVPSQLLISWNRFFGEYHRFVLGHFLEPGEQECYRARLLAVRSHAVDRHAIIAHGALCIVTGRRIMVENDHGLHLQLQPGSIRAIRALRDYDPRDGFSYWVVMERIGSLMREPEGDIGFRCVDQQHSQALCAAIQGTTAIADPT